MPPATPLNDAGATAGRDVLLVADGVGITPMRALLETMPLGPGEDLLLLYRARSAEDLLSWTSPTTWPRARAAIPCPSRCTARCQTSSRGTCTCAGRRA